MGILQGAGRRNLLVFYDVFYNAEKLLKEFENSAISMSPALSTIKDSVGLI